MGSDEEKLLQGKVHKPFRTAVGEVAFWEGARPLRIRVGRKRAEPLDPRIQPHLLRRVRLRCEGQQGVAAADETPFVQLLQRNAALPLHILDTALVEAMDQLHQQGVGESKVVPEPELRVPRRDQLMEGCPERDEYASSVDAGLAIEEWSDAKDVLQHAQLQQLGSSPPEGGSLAFAELTQQLNRHEEATAGLAHRCVKLGKGSEQVNGGAHHLQSLTPRVHGALPRRQLRQQSHLLLDANRSTGLRH
mmetsp:Transcript_82292/g.218353  ORF Transcript_82292/g.218353 Transcript_82292/m.218353 type:complete len:248 (-) Transcript_82292:216-959(-)